VVAVPVSLGFGEVGLWNSLSWMVPWPAAPDVLGAQLGARGLRGMVM